MIDKKVKMSKSLKGRTLVRHTSTAQTLTILQTKTKIRKKTYESIIVFDFFSSNFHKTFAQEYVFFLNQLPTPISYYLTNIREY